jgi:Pyridine nucleotide-disulphide oxidoreductase, dimerisation domain
MSTHDWFSARTYAETVAWSNVIVDRCSDRILGAHFVGHAGQELVNIFGLAMKFGIRAGASRAHLRLSGLRVRHKAHARPRLSRIARRYRLNSQPAFPEAKALRDAHDMPASLSGPRHQARRQRHVQ